MNGEFEDHENVVSTVLKRAALAYNAWEILVDGIRDYEGLMYEEGFVRDEFKALERELDACAGACERLRHLMGVEFKEALERAEQRRASKADDVMEVDDE